MKLHIATSGGPSRSVVVSAEREDLVALADALKSGERTFSGITSSSGYDGLEFRVVSDIATLERTEARKGRYVLPALLGIMAFACAILYLAYLGIRTLILS